MNKVLVYMYPHIKNLALAEGYPCHAISILVRLFPCVDTHTLVKWFLTGRDIEQIEVAKGISHQIIATIKEMK